MKNDEYSYTCPIYASSQYESNSPCPIPKQLSQKGKNHLAESQLVGLQVRLTVFCSVFVEDQQRTNKIHVLLSWASREVCTSVSQQLGFESVTL